MTRKLSAVPATLFLATLFFEILLAAPSLAQTKPFADPANLRGERIRPRDGRELPIDGGSAIAGDKANTSLGLHQLLRKLNTRASLMLIIAHPDDEDGGMLTFYSRGLGARVAMLTLTRGEGGQNAMTSDFGDALGLLRTQELLAADRYTGTDQFFGTEVDFGFSKTKEEAFAKWTHDRVLYDAVRAVRLYRPLVIASTWVGGVTDGHGHHQVSGQIAQEVFTAAGDPKVFPELTAEGILPWQPLKVYARVPMQSISAQGLFDYATGQYTPARFTNYVTGAVTTTPPSADVLIHEGLTDPLLTPAAANAADLAGTSLATAAPDTPLSYVQFARIGLGLQRSQIGPGVRSAPRGNFDIAYHLYASRLDAAHRKPQEDSFFDGIDTSVAGLAAGLPALPPTPPGAEPHWSNAQTIRIRVETTSAEIRQASDWDATPDNRAQLPTLLADIVNRNSQAIRLLEAEPLDAALKANILHELRVKRVQLNDALALALHLSVEVTATSAALPLSTPQTLTVEAPGPLSPPYPPSTIRIETANGLTFPIPVPSAPSSAPAIKHYNAFPVELPAPFTQQVSRPYFVRSNIEQAFYDVNVPALRNAPQTPPALTAWATFDFHGIPVEVGRVVHNHRQPSHIVPPLGVSLASHAQVLPSSARSFLVDSSVQPSAAGSHLSLTVPPGWQTSPDPQANAAPYDATLLTVDRPLRKTIVISFAVSAEGKTERFTEGFRSIGYNDLPRTNYFTPATVRIVPVELQLPARHRLAYLPGTGDAVPEALASLGLTPTLITLGDLTSASLARFDTVILGVRTYAAHPDLHGAPTQALLDFARSGGNVVVQYQTAEFTAADAPFPLTLGDAEKVVDETAPVVLLDAANPLLTTPNKITPADFNNWVEERGHGFLRTWDPHYAALTETHDPGSAAESVRPQAPQRGGLLTTPLGKGRWTYVAFALYRQLPEAVPGAFRVLVNLVNP